MQLNAEQQMMNNIQLQNLMQGQYQPPATQKKYYIPLKVVPVVLQNLDSSYPADYGKNFQQIAEENGFDYESHKVTTDDGYILNVFRIRQPGLAAGAPVAFCQHGLLSAANTWIMNEPDVAPAFQLARQGYDVFLGNNRGNMNSPDHTTWTQQANPSQYFNYSFQDLGEHDLPTQINLALEKSGASKLTYLAHSQGTSQMFYALTTNQDFFLQKVNLFVALAPVVRLTNVEMGIEEVSKWIGSGPLSSIAHYFGMYSVASPTQRKKTSGFLEELESSSVLDDLADKFMDAVSTKNPRNNAQRDLASESWSPAQASVKECMHYVQLMHTGNFQKFDNGADQNQKMYGQSTPPLLDLTSIQLPIAMFVGKNDVLADPTDTQWVHSQVPSVVHYQEMDNFDHGSFMNSNDMSYFDNVLSLVSQYKQ